MARFNASSAYLLKAAVDSGITSPAELAAFMGNADIETAGFTRMRESFQYTTVKKVINASSSAAKRFSIEEIQAAVDSREPSRIATVLYEGRNEKDLGNSEVGDGWRFHGRGYFQFTGRYNYETSGKKIGVDLISDPDLAAGHEVSAKLAIAYWNERVPAHLREDPIAAGVRINGAKHAAARRLAASREWEAIISPELVSAVKAGTVTLDHLEKMGASTKLSGQPQSRDGVRQLQAKLTRLGYVDPAGCELKIDGDYGRRTRLAVQEFQRRHGLVDDGVAGPLTLTAVDRAVETELRSIGQPDAPYLRSGLPVEPLSAYRSLAPEHIAVPSMPVVPPDVLEPAGHAHYREARAFSRGEVSGYVAALDRPSDNEMAVPASFPVSEARRPDWQDPRHPRSALHDLYTELGRRVPDASEDRLLQFTAACHENCITAQNMVEARLDEQRGTLTFIGTGPLTQPAHIDLKSPPPYPEEAMQQIQQHDLQQQQVMEQVRAQQAQMGMSHSR